MTTEPWSHWNESDWNRALFMHYFGADENDTPVTRLLVNARGIAQAVGLDSAQVSEVDESFRKVLIASPRRINARFRGTKFPFSAPYDEPPPAVIHLLFTCYVASAREEMRSEADFRRRMAAVLHHPEGTIYPLERLGDLWIALKAWLGRARAEGHGWRELALPAPGRMVRIGYSLRLAFPHWRDQVLLDRIVAAQGFAAQPPLCDIAHALRPHRDKFSEAFRAVYEDFRRSVIAGTPDCEHSPLLEAVHDAVMHGDVLREASAQCPKLCLIAGRDEWDDFGCLRLLLLCARSPSARSSPRVGSFEPDRSLSEFPYAVTFDSADFNGAHKIVDLLLAGELSGHLQEFESVPLYRLAKDGVFLFHSDTSGILECALNLNVEDEVWALVHRRHAREFREALSCAGSSVASPFASLYDDWVEFPPIKAASLRAVDWSSHPGLSRVRCLQRCVPESRLSIFGGVPTGEPRTWFGHHAVLPMVRVRGGAETVILKKEGGLTVAHGARIDGEADLFLLRPLASEGPWEGEHVVTARTVNEQTMRKRVCFRAYVDGFEYLAPSKPDRWLCESSFFDMDRWHPEAVFGGAETGGSGFFSGSIQVGARDETVSNDAATLLEALTETCAMRCCRRRDFSVNEWIELFNKIFGFPDVRLARLVLRAWVEAGHFDQALDTTWRTWRLFARKPRLAVAQDATGTKARVLGLIPAMLVNQLQCKVAALGGWIKQRASVSPWVAGPWEIGGLDFSVLKSLARALSLAETVQVPASATLHASIQNLSPYLSQRPMNYVLFRCWSWNRSRFLNPSHAEDLPVQLEWWQRLDRPDYFLIRAGDKVWTTYSRNWALLAAASFANATPFHHANGQVTSAGFPWVFLPISIGRFCFAAGAGAAGPVRSDDGTFSYVYPLGSVRRAASVLQTLGFGNSPNRIKMPQWLEALAALRLADEPLVPVAIGAASRRRVPVSLRPLFVAHGRLL